MVHLGAPTGAGLIITSTLIQETEASTGTATCPRPVPWPKASEVIHLCWSTVLNPLSQVRDGTPILMDANQVRFH